MALTLEELVQAVERLDAQLPLVLEEAREIKRMVQKPGLTATDICRDYLHRSTSWALERPWVLPNFGIPDVAGRPKVWWRATCERWYEVPLEVREAQWWRKDEREREQLNRRRLAA